MAGICHDHASAGKRLAEKQQDARKKQTLMDGQKPRKGWRPIAPLTARSIAHRDGLKGLVEPAHHRVRLHQQRRDHLVFLHAPVLGELFEHLQGRAGLPPLDARLRRRAKRPHTPKNTTSAKRENGGENQKRMLVDANTTNNTRLEKEENDGERKNQKRIEAELGGKDVLYPPAALVDSTKKAK